MQTPLLILSDAPTSGTGLGRITRDLAVRVHANLPEFRVGTAGYGGTYSAKLGFPQYQLDMENWVIHNLQEIWEDFSDGEQGVLMTIWDASRLLWLSRPENCRIPQLAKWLQKRPFKLWGYFPIDATGPNDKLTGVLKYTIEGFDRVLAYSKWAEDILRRTLTSRPILDSLANLPHGIDTSVFYPRPRTVARHGFGERIGARTQKGKFYSVSDDAFLIGIVATNQIRKDWPLGIQVAAEIAKTRKIALWCHVDQLERHHSIPALLTDYGLTSDSIVTNVPLTDEQMAYCYSAFDVTFGIGAGEGLGYPIFESLACGTPCIHGDYGGAAEHMPFVMRVTPREYRMETPYCCVRPVFKVLDWCNAVWESTRPTNTVSLPVHLDWNNLWPRWADWFRRGLQ